VGVPSRHIENFPHRLDTTALKKASEWQKRGFLILLGKSRVGKSFGAAWTLREFLKSRITDPFGRSAWTELERASSSVVWCAAIDITIDREMATRAAEAPMAVIDALGCEDSLRGGVAAIRHVISKRYDSMFPTAITTELIISDIGQRYGMGSVLKLTEDIGQGGRVVDCGDAPVDCTVTR
jgi:hypothetical protein